MKRYGTLAERWRIDPTARLEVLLAAVTVLVGAYLCLPFESFAAAPRLWFLLASIVADESAWGILIGSLGGYAIYASALSGAFRHRAHSVLTLVGLFVSLGVAFTLGDVRSFRGPCFLLFAGFAIDIYRDLARRARLVKLSRARASGDAA